MKTNTKTLLVLLLILVVAGFFRFYKITSYPPGLFPDEAANGIDAQSITEGIHSPFFERGNGREALYFYLIAVSFKFFGVGVWQIHLVSASLGVLAVLGVFLLAKEWFNTHIGLWSAWLSAISVPAIVMARVGFRSVLLTVTAVYFFYFATLALKPSQTKHKRLIMSCLAGLFFGLNWYTYIAARVLAGVVLILVILAIIIDYRLIAKNFIKRYYQEILVGLATFMVAFLPLLHYFVTHSGSFTGRASHVSVFNPDLNGGDVTGTILLNLKETALMFAYQGDLNWRHNVSGDGWFEPVTAILFYLAFIYFLIDVFTNLYLTLIKKKKDSRKKLFIELAMFGWFLGALMPMVITAEGIPHFLRAQGIIPVVYIFPAWFLYQTLSWLKSKKYLNSWGAQALTIVIVLYIAINSYNSYFVKAFNDKENYYSFRSDLTTVSETINKINDKRHTFLVLDEFSVQTVKFLTKHNHNPYELVKPEEAFAWKYVNKQQVLDRPLTVIFTQSTIFDTKKFKETYPGAKLIKQEKNRWGQVIMEVYSLELET